MRLNREAFERSEGLELGACYRALTEHPDGVAVYTRWARPRKRTGTESSVASWASIPRN
jgi:hypothetical protein